MSLPLNALFNADHERLAAAAIDRAAAAVWHCPRCCAQRNVAAAVLQRLPRLKAASYLTKAMW